jgi:hypothetical protein
MSGPLSELTGLSALVRSGGAGRLRAATGAVVYWSVGAIKIC